MLTIRNHANKSRSRGKLVVNNRGGAFSLQYVVQKFNAKFYGYIDSVGDTTFKDAFVIYVTNRVRTLVSVEVTTDEYRDYRDVEFVVKNFVAVRFVEDFEAVFDTFSYNNNADTIETIY